MGFPTLFFGAMPRQEVIKKVKTLAEGIASDNSFELVDVELLGSDRKTVIRVTIDKEGGVDLDDCQIMSRELESLLDVEDPFVGRYTLEVSSPGIDRPLKKIEDFVRFTGKKARIITKEKMDNQSFFIGIIKDVKENDILIQLEKKTVLIPFNGIKKATLEIEL